MMMRGMTRLMLALAFRRTLNAVEEIA